MVCERIRACGHRNVSATHDSTLELTTDDWLTPAGDCIIGIEADRAPATFDERFVRACQDADARIDLVLVVGERTARISGRGDPALTFESDRSLVCRTSTYVDDRTVLVEADRAATDLDRGLVDELADGAVVRATLQVTPRSDPSGGEA